MGKGDTKKFDTAQAMNSGAAATAAAIPEKTTQTGQYMAGRALARVKALDENGSAELKGYELFNPEQFADRESQMKTGMETLNAPMTNPNYIAGIQEENKDRRMRDRANSALGAYQGARQNAIGESYTAEGDTRSALAMQMQGQLGAAGNQTSLASAYNQRKRWYDPVIGMAMQGAQAAAMGG